MSVDLEVLEDLQSEGWLKSQRHPTLPLTIWNYTPKTQYEGHWNEWTMMCRGLMTDDYGAIVARPFPKFFNLDEHIAKIGPLPDEPFTITEKLDGSLIIVVRWNGYLIFASRGSFTSPQVQMAREVAARPDWPLGSFEMGVTHLFELIHPQNRIVVNYGLREDLILLARIHTKTGQELSPHRLGFREFRTVRSVLHEGGFRDLPQHPNTEGYVIRFQSGVRVKVKTEEYMRLHRIITGTNARTIWEYLKDGRDIAELLENTPDEFSEWVRETAQELMFDWKSLKICAQIAFFDLPHGKTRKELAEKIKKLPHPFPPLVFCLLDGKSIDDLVWKYVKPKPGEFLSEEDAV